LTTLILVGVLGVLLGCLLGSGATLVATHFHHGGSAGYGRFDPGYGARRGPGFGR
jgi:hypothetical protein